MLVNMSRKTLLIASGMMAVAAWTVNVSAQRIVTGFPVSAPDLLTAQVVEIKDGTDAVVLRGTWSTSREKPDHVDRMATFVTSGTAAAARATIEILRPGNVITKNEIEVHVKQLPAQASFTLNVDGRRLLTFATNRRGGANLKLTSRLPPTQAP